VLQDWQRYYGGNLLIVLPDAFGTDAFLRDAPDWVADWTGFRPDSAPPIEAASASSHGGSEEGPRPEAEAADLLGRARRRHHQETYKHFDGKVRMAFGWGTNLTNDFEDCAPTPTDRLDAISLVCKVIEANGRPAVKLSDNPRKGDGRHASEEICFFQPLLIGGALAVAASFWALAFVRPATLQRYTAVRSPLFEATERGRLAASLISFLFLIALIAAGFLGRRRKTRQDSRSCFHPTGS
jgi:hypothetical protein